MLLVILPSLKRNMLGDISNFVVYGDSSALPSQASQYGKPTCDCRKQGIYNCGHGRVYYDATADFGYDPHRDIFYFGHKFYQHCTSYNGHDLPLHITIGQASETDFTLSIKSFDRMVKTFHEHGFDPTFYAACYDSGHDARGVYDYHLAMNNQPVIPLNPRSGNPRCTGTATVVNSEGIPLCDAGIPMQLRHHDKRRGRIYFCCPVKRPSKKNGEYVWNVFIDECPNGALCQPDTKRGPVVYVRSDQDPRMYPAIPRDSAEYKKIMNGRSSCERSNSAKKETYNLGNRPFRSSGRYLLMLYIISIIEHAKSWFFDDLKAADGDFKKLAESLVINAA